MDATNLTAIAGLILSISIASERLVEIIKGCFPIIDQKHPDPTKESRRRSFLQFLAVVSGVVTSYLARELLPESVTGVPDAIGIIGIGLLASGGSGMWNSVLSYLVQVKDIKKVELQKLKDGL